MKCKYCGADIPEGTTICRHCGQLGKSANEKIQCASCGSMASRSNPFCTVCGAFLVEQSERKKSTAKRIVPILIILSLLVSVLIIACIVVKVLDRSPDEAYGSSQTDLITGQNPQVTSGDIDDGMPSGQDAVYDTEGPGQEEIGGEDGSGYSEAAEEVTVEIPARYFTKRVEGNLNVRALPKHESGLVCTVKDQTLLYFYGEVEQGLGSDHAMHDWYKITIDQSTQGWVRSDLVQEVYLSN